MAKLSEPSGWIAYRNRNSSLCRLECRPYHAGVVLALDRQLHEVNGQGDIDAFLLDGRLWPPGG